MQFASPLIPGTLTKRYKRFLADVLLDNGETVTAHCPNTGAMTGCAEPGYRVWLSPSNNPKRKLAYTWELAQTDAGHWIGINTQHANKVVREAVEHGQIDALGGYNTIKSEVKYGNENSRIDLLLQSPGRPDCYVEIKSVTLLQDGQGYFPDAVTQRGTRHLRELIEMVRQGHRAVLFFCVQHTGIVSVQAAAQIDPEYADTLAECARHGVEILAGGCQIDEEKILLNQSLPVKM